MTGTGRRVVGTSSRVVVAGIGNEFRQDDAVGIAVARAVASAMPEISHVGPLGEPLDLLGRWDGADLAVVVDACRASGPSAAVGAVRVGVLEPGSPASGGVAGELPRSPTSTHGIGVEGVWRISAAIGSAPGRIVVVAIAACHFDQGEGLCPQVLSAVPEAAAAVMQVIRRFLSSGSVTAAEQ